MLLGLVALRTGQGSKIHYDAEHMRVMNSDYGQADRGHIALQEHGDRVWYRNVKIRSLR
jgi:hypothetical protein